MNLKLGITVSTFPAKFGPIVFSGSNLSENLYQISGLGYDGVDLFMHRFTPTELEQLRNLVQALKLEVALALAYFLSEEGVNLSDPDLERRLDSVQQFKAQIEVAAQLGVKNMPIGFLRGFNLEGETLQSYEQRLAESLKELSKFGATRGVSLLLEPMNRYEINTMNRVDQSLEFLEKYHLETMGLLLDTFHMNIEDASMEKAIRIAGPRISHIHITDSNRLAPGQGHLNYDSLLQAIIQTGYSGFLTIEALPLPSPLECASLGRNFLQNKLLQLQKNRAAF
jgi:sugar phosphate isomerase/epimerase